MTRHTVKMVIIGFALAVLGWVAVPLPQTARAAATAETAHEVASVAEQAIPPPELPPDQRPVPMNQRTMPKTLALTLGAIQVLIVIGAILLAVMLPTRRPPA